MKEALAVVKSDIEVTDLTLLYATVKWREPCYNLHISHLGCKISTGKF